MFTTTPKRYRAVVQLNRSPLFSQRREPFSGPFFTFQDPMYQPCLLGPFCAFCSVFLFCPWKLHLKQSSSYDWRIFIPPSILILILILIWTCVFLTSSCFVCPFFWSVSVFLFVLFRLAHIYQTKFYDPPLIFHPPVYLVCFLSVSLFSLPSLSHSHSLPPPSSLFSRFLSLHISRLGLSLSCTQ